MTEIKKDDIVINASKLGDMSDSLQEQMQMIGRFGIYDTKDDCWLGDENGPKEFTYFLIARLAADVCSDQLGINRSTRRFKAMELPTNTLRKKDEMPVKRTALKSLTRIENGKDI